MNASDIYERIRAALCPFHGFESDEVLEWHARAITLQILSVRGLLPRAQRAA